MHCIFTIKLLFILTKCVLAYRITFPESDEFKNGCRLSNSEVGSCINFKICVTLHNEHDGENVKTCYFEGFEQYVCCPNNTTSMKDNSIQIPTESKKPLGLTQSQLLSPALPVFSFPPLPAEPKLTTNSPLPTSTILTKNSRLPKPCSEPSVFRITVVLGLKTDPDEFPFMVALGWRRFANNVYDYRCGGALIAEDWILTAAHCAFSDGLPPIVALPGGVHLNSTAQTVYKIKRVIEHPDYNPQQSYNDIALIELEEPIREKHIKPACLLESNTFANGGNVTAIGYGHTRFAGTPSNELLKAYLNIVDEGECKKYYERDDMLPQGLLDSQVCAKDPENLRDTCQGDSGGPLVLYAGLGIAYIVGVTSFGQACAKEPPGVYTRVSAYSNWIDSIVWPNGSNVIMSQ